MRNILFTAPTDEKILSGQKTMTARFWAITPPSLNQIVTASTGRKKETRFAEIRIVGGCIWYPIKDTARDIEKRTGYSLGEIAEKEGFARWEDFVNAYVSLNQHLDPDDPKREHYFIEFELVKNLREDHQIESRKDTVTA